MNLPPELLRIVMSFLRRPVPLSALRRASLHCPSAALACVNRAIHSALGFRRGPYKVTVIVCAPTILFENWKQLRKETICSGHTECVGVLLRRLFLKTWRLPPSFFKCALDMRDAATAVVQVELHLAPTEVLVIVDDYLTQNQFVIDWFFILDTYAYNGRQNSAALRPMFTQFIFKLSNDPYESELRTLMPPNAVLMKHDREDQIILVDAV